jgi:fatty-acyl-CoA synthase
MRVGLLTPQEAVVAARTVLRSGLVRPYRPDRLLRISLGALRYGMGSAAGPMIGASAEPHAPAIVDESGSATMRELDERCSAVAGGLHAAGFGPATWDGVLARNSAAFYEVAVGASRLGLDVIYLNTGFVADQIAAIAADRSMRGLVFDPEFADRVPASVRPIPTDGEPAAGVGTVRAMAATTPAGTWSPDRPGRHIILSSGTTGRPKDVARTGGGWESVVAVLSDFPCGSGRAISSPHHCFTAGGG